MSTILPFTSDLICIHETVMQPCKHQGIHRLKLVELLDSFSSSRKHAKNIKTDLFHLSANTLMGNSIAEKTSRFYGSLGTYGLAQWSTLSNSNLITLLNTESWRDVCSKVLVSLLVSSVLRDEMKVFSADNKCTVHFGGDDSASQDTATNRNETGERAFLV